MPKALYRSFYDCYHLPPSPRHSENKMKNLKKTYLSIYAVTIQQIQILEIALLLFENFVLKLLINACLYIQLIITNQRDSWLLDTYSNATLTPNNSRPFYTIDILISLEPIKFTRQSIIYRGGPRHSNWEANFFCISKLWTTFIAKSYKIPYCLMKNYSEVKLFE